MNIHRNALDRRQLLRIGGAGFLVLHARSWRHAETALARMATAMSVIFLYQFGGPSHVDTFDMKPDAPDGIRSHFDTIDTNVPGVRICQHLPAMAKVMDKVTLVRTVYHNMKNHNSASYYALTGHAPPLDDIRLRDSLDLFPAYGSVVDRLAPVSNGMPTFVAYPHVIRDGANTPGQHASFLGKGHDPLLITQDPNAAGFKLPELRLPDGLSVERLSSRREMQSLLNSQTELNESVAARGLEAYYEKALAMLNRPEVRTAFDLSREPDAIRERYGRTSYG